MSPPERRGDHDAPYWTADIAIGDGQFYDDNYAIRLALHEETEHSFGRSEIFPLTATTGSRLYFHAHPYILLPDIRLEVGLYPQPRGEAIGEVERSSGRGCVTRSWATPRRGFIPRNALSYRLFGISGCSTLLPRCSA